MLFSGMHGNVQDCIQCIDDFNFIKTFSYSVDQPEKGDIDRDVNYLKIS